MHGVIRAKLPFLVISALVLTTPTPISASSLETPTTSPTSTRMATTGTTAAATVKAEPKINQLLNSKRLEKLEKFDGKFGELASVPFPLHELRVSGGRDSEGENDAH